jgi:hypothetical protein
MRIRNGPQLGLGLGQRDVQRTLAELMPANQQL